MVCPSCGYLENKVLDSRDTPEGAIRRRRECLRCKTRFTTYERIEAPHFLVIKKDGRREPYSRQKLLIGIQKACEKRPVSQERIEKVVGRVEKKLSELGDKEIPTALVGELVMKELKKVDSVAYIRFASVYREFKDVEDFKQELRRIGKSK